MNRLIQQWKACRNVFSQVEEIHKLASEHYADPPPWLIALPLVYKHISNKVETDSNLLSAVGQYLHSTFPSFKEYLMDDEQRHIRDTLYQSIDDVFKDPV